MKRSSSFFITHDQKDLPLGDLLKRLKTNDFGGADLASPITKNKEIEIENASSYSLDSNSLLDDQEPAFGSNVFPQFNGSKDSTKYAKREI